MNPPNQHVTVVEIGANREAYIAYTLNPDSKRLTITAMIEVKRHRSKDHLRQVTRVIRTENPKLWVELRQDLRSTLNLD